MQARQNRRKGPTPIVNRRNEDVWDRTLKAMGLQPLDSNSPPATTMGSSNIASVPVSTTSCSATTSKKVTILDLPLETQKGIFEYSSPSDLLALSLVSKHFRDIAAEHLYRSFHIIFPGEDDALVDPPVDALAGGLDTFVTSEYNYARYLREIILEPSFGGEHSEHIYRSYLSDVSCGKFMNTLLLLTLRKAKSLETFKWDIRVEPSRQVFKALHETSALKHLHIRMHAGNSIYNTPPSIFAQSNAPSNVSLPHHPHPHPQFGFSSVNPLPVPVQPTIEFYSSGIPSNQFVVGSHMASKSHHRGLKAPLRPARAVSPTFSGFRNLKTLAVIDMDTLDYISEIRECIKHSSSTLKTLLLSFSELLASKSRKPPPELNSDDETDQEDDFTQLAPPPPGAPPPGMVAPPEADAPSKTLKAQEEKKKQEAVLAKIFGLDQAISKPVEPTAAEVAEKKLADDPQKIFMRNLVPLGKLFLKTIKDESELSEAGKEALNVMAKASKLYLEALEAKGGKAAVGVSQSNSNESPVPSYADVDDGIHDTSTTERGLFDEPETKGKRDTHVDADVSNPDDIDVEAPDVQDLPVDFESATPESQQDTVDAIEATEVESMSVAATTGTSKEDIDEPDPEKTPPFQFLSYYVEEKKRLHQFIENGISEWDKILNSGDVDSATKDKISRSLTNILDDTARLELEFKSIVGSSTAFSGVKKSLTKISEYVRSTRGLALHTLAIYLIPIRASVLTKAIDIHTLQDITLLDVGHQIAFWTIAAKENKVSPLPLKRIYTDNVTIQFLAFINQLDRVEHLLLLERKQNTVIESTTPKTTVMMDQIRRIVLMKHASTLKVLMIQNDDTPDWDLNIKSAILLCQRAKQLEELAVSFGTRTMHTLLQFMPGLTSLRALHTLQFRHEDTCLWVMREFRKFAVDAVSHNPEMKLEYLALDTIVERLVRRPPKKVDKKGKGKEKQGGVKGKSLAELALLPNSSFATGSSLLKLGILPNIAIDYGDSDDEDLEVGGKLGLRVETIENIQFSNIPGVRIFEKDVVCARL